jgi:hypothetical protein
VPDSTINSIDRLFDFVDSSVEKLDRVLNRGKYTAEQHQARRRVARADDTAGSKLRPRAKRLAPPPTTTSALVHHKQRLHIVESISSSGTLYVVTDGGSARVECSTREMAQKILHALEKP